jgi:UDP-N-acetylmuramate dehydrogenase
MRAAFLIENCGLKGFMIGQAQVSNKHANFIINRGAAKAADVAYLIDIIKEKVYLKSGVILKEEIVRWEI